MLTEESMGFTESEPVPKQNDPEAVRRFRAAPTNYGSGRTCSYGEKKKTCDPSCRFWKHLHQGKT